MFIISPVADLDITILKITQGCHSELAALGDNLCAGVILHALGGLTLGQLQQLVDQDVLQVTDLGVILFVNLRQLDLILSLRLAVLDSTQEQFLVDDDTRKRRIGLQ